MAAPRQPTDLYRFIHKALRRKLFASSVLTGATDVRNDASWIDLRTHLDDLVRTLRAHAAHEERFIHPLLADRLPMDHRRLEADHAEGEDAIARLLEDPDQTYARLNRLIADYLPHLDREESLMPRLRERATEDEIAGILKAFQASRTPSEGLEDLKLIVPALNLPERAGILEGIRDHAPAGVFESVCGVLSSVLERPSWIALQQYLARA